MTTLEQIRWVPVEIEKPDHDGEWFLLQTKDGRFYVGAYSKASEEWVARDTYEPLPDVVTHWASITGAHL